MIIYGDSYTSGENNDNISFADYLGVKKCGVSGSCLDEYSIYPVRNGSFLTLCREHDETVLLEYGVNDAASLASGYVSKDTVRVSIAKAADMLRNSKVYFLALTESQRDLRAFCARYVDYLNNDYLKDLRKVSRHCFQSSYELFVSLMQRKFPTLYMLPSGFQDFCEDGIHPTNEGYATIAEHLKTQFFMYDVR